MAHSGFRQTRFAGYAGTLAAAAALLAACQTGGSQLASETASPQGVSGLQAKHDAKANAPCADYADGAYAPPFPTECAGIQSSQSGLRWIEIAAGPDGRESPLEGATVIVAYEGYLASTGVKFDSSYDRGEAAVFVIDQVIDGWTELLKKMTPGDEWLVYIPSELAYGETSPAPSIPAKSDLVFKIRLDGFLNADEVESLGQ